MVCSRWLSAGLHAAAWCAIAPVLASGQAARAGAEAPASAGAVDAGAADAGAAVVAGAMTAVGATTAAAAPIAVPGTRGEGLWSGARGAAAGGLASALTEEDARGIPLVRLGALDVGALALEDAMNEMPGAPMRIGVSRAISEAGRAGRWFDVGGGERVWAVEIEAEGALAQRPRLTGMDLPPGATVVVREIGADGRAGRAYGPWGGRGPWGRGEMWSPTLWSSRVRVECRVPAGVEAHGSWRGAPLRGAQHEDAPPLVVGETLHIYRGGGGSGGESGGGAPRGAEATELPCHLDVSCFPEWEGVARAVGRLAFIHGGAMELCSGQLINTVAGDLTPYFLTANHCVSTPEEAESGEIYWLYQTPSCNGTPPSLASVPRSVGMTYIDSFSATDYSLNMVIGALPEGVAWVGWETGSVATGTPLAGISQPAGSYKRIMFGTKASAAMCRNETNFFGVNETMGVIEQGSSGSGVFRASSHSLVGHLFGSCDLPACANTFAVYGDFWRTYPMIAAQLAAGPDDALEPNGACAQFAALGLGTHAGLVVKSVNEDWYRVTIAPGRKLTATAAFANSGGDIDLELWRTCGSNAVDGSYGSGDEERVSAENGGPTPRYALVRVFLASSTRNTYALTISDEAGCGGDANGDGVVDFLDLNIVLGEYGTAAETGAMAGDLNFDGVVDFLDLNILLGRYGMACPR